MKILVINQHTCNRGDQAAGRAVIASLLKEFPDAKIIVLYRYNQYQPPIWEETERVKHYPNLGMHCGSKSTSILNLVMLALGRRHGFLGSSGRFIELIQDADLVVNAPTGPNIGDKYEDRQYMAALIAAIWSGKRVCMYGSSVGPFRKLWVRVIARYIFNRMEFVCVRETQSFDFLKSLKLKHERIHSSADAALQRKIEPSEGDVLYENCGIPTDKTLVGVVPLGYQWYPDGMNSMQYEEQVVDRLAAVLNRVMDDRKSCIVFFPQLFSIENDEVSSYDLPIIRKVQSKLNCPENSFIVSPQIDSDMQQKMISRLNFLISMRYHPSIFAAKMRVPFVAISYEHKMTTFMRAMNLEKLQIQFTDFLNEPELVHDRIEYIVRNRHEVEVALNDKLPIYESLSSKGTELIKAVFFGNSAKS